MAHEAVVKGVSAYLEANWDKCVVVGLNGEGEPPGNGEPFVILQFPAARARRVSVGTRYYREEGGVRIVLNMQRGEGSNRPLEWVTELTALFRDKRFGGIRFQVPGSPVFDDANDEGNYFVVAFTAPYTFDYVG
jgi:hypothetical protein